MSLRTAAIAATLAAALLAGCETTQQESAKIARALGHRRADPGTTTIARSNAEVHVVRAALLAGSPAAVALELVNDGAFAQSAIPIAIEVRDAAGDVAYRNDTHGIEPSLQQLGLLGAHRTAWWVDNEVLAAGRPAAVSALIGAGAAAADPSASAGAAVASDGFPGPHVDVTLRNGGRRALRELAVYAVALRGGRVVGAGRALVASLAPGAAATALVPMTGAVDGARVAVSVAG